MVGEVIEKEPVVLSSLSADSNSVVKWGKTSATYPNWPSQREVLKEDIYICVSRSSDLYKVALTKTNLYLRPIHDRTSVDIFSLNDLFDCSIYDQRNSTESTVQCSKDKDVFLRFCFYIRKKTHIPFHGGSGSTDTNSRAVYKVCRKRTVLAFHVKKLGKTFEQNFQLATEWKQTISVFRSNNQNIDLKRKDISFEINMFNKVSTNKKIKTEDKHSGLSRNELHQETETEENNTSSRAPGMKGTEINTLSRAAVGRFGMFNVFSRFGSYRMQPFSVSKATFLKAYGDSEHGLNVTSIDAQRAYQDELGLAVQSWNVLQKPMLIILNPKSGKGASLSIYHRTNDILKAAGIRGSLFITQCQGHAKSLLMCTEDLMEIQGIVVIGGDGLMSEVVNGLRNRSDSKEYLELTVGSIPSGSANGLARSLAHYCDEGSNYLNDPVLQAVLTITHGKAVPVNLAEVDLDYKKMYSFLSVGWGFVSDVDIESEVFRKLGEVRFFLWSLVCLLRFRSYLAQLCYKPLDGMTSTSETSEKTIIDGRFVSVYSCLQSHIGTKLPLAPMAKQNDGWIHLSIIRDNIGRINLSKFVMAVEKGEHFKVPGVQYVKTKEFTLKKGEGDSEGNLTIDGERVSGEYIRVRICPNPLYVFSH